MENIIGSILISESVKNIGPMYKIAFTDSRAVALVVDPSRSLREIYASPDETAATTPGSANNAAFGMVTGIKQGVELWESMKKMEEVFININNSRKSIVSYEKQELSSEMIGKNSIIMPYDKIKKVVIKKAVRENTQPEKLAYSIIFNIGMLSSENFMFPGVAVDEVTALLKKTPLSSKFTGII